MSTTSGASATTDAILDLRPGADAIFHDPGHFVYYLNGGALFIGSLLLLAGFVELRSRMRQTGRLWTSGTVATALGLVLMVLGAGVQVALALVGWGPLAETVGIVFAIGLLLAFVGALPLGIVLLRRTTAKAAGALFVATLPLFVVGTFVIAINNTLSDLLMGPVYAVAWIALGYYLWTHSEGARTMPVHAGSE